MPRGIGSAVYCDNSVGTTGGGAIAYYFIKETLKSAGWTVPRSSDGSTYNSSGDQITTTSTGAGGVANVNAWFVLQSPAAIGSSSRFFCVQILSLSNTNQMRIKYALSDFSGGSPSATQVPSATGEVVLRGGGTDGAPTGTRVWSDATAGTQRVIGVADAFSPYGFVFTHKRTDSSTDTDEGRFAMDPIIISSGVTHADTDPFVLHVGGGDAWNPTNISAISQTAGTQDPGIGMDQAGTYGTFCLMGLQNFGGTGGLTIPDDSATGASADTAAHDPWSSLYGLVPLIYANRTSGIKGTSSLIHGRVEDWNSTLANRLQMVTVDGETRAYLAVGAYFIPWGSSTPATGSWTTDTGQIWTIDSADLPLFGARRSVGSAAGTATATTSAMTAAPTDEIAPEIVVNTTTEIRSTTPIDFDVTDAGDFSIIAITVTFPDGTCEVAHDGDAFVGEYTREENVRTAITNGYNYTILRNGGWHLSPTVGFQIADSSGNIAEIP